MRNLKRALSLALASVMLLGMMVVGTSAKGLDDFNDAAEIVNKDAVAVIADLGIMVGDDADNFNGDQIVTRAEAAVIVAKMLYGADVKVAQFAENNAFNDLQAWNAGYVNLVASLGIVAGYGDGKYGPNDQLTTAQFANILAKTLGWFQNEADYGNNWALAATAKGTEIGLFEGLDVKANDPLTRENVAAMTFNALTKSIPVQYNSLLGVYYNENQGITAKLEFEYTETLGYTNFDLVYLTGETAEYGRPAVTWGTGSYKGELGEDGELLNKPGYVKMTSADEIVTVAETPDIVYTANQKNKDVYNDLSKSSLEYGWTAYVDGEDDETATKPVKGNGSRYVYTNKGATTEIYIDDVNESVVVVMINEYMAEVTKVKEDDDGEYANVKILTPGVTVDTKKIYCEGFEKGDYVIVTVDYDEDEAESFVATIAEPEVVEGVVAKVRKTEDKGGNEGNYVVMEDGEKYTYSANTASDLADLNEIHPTLDTEYALFLDSNGWVAGFKALEDYYANYLIVVYSDFEMGTATAKVVFADGTAATIEIDEVDGKDPIKEDWKDKDVEKQNKVYAWTEADGVYSLRSVMTAGGDRDEDWGTEEKPWKPFENYKDTQELFDNEAIYNDAAYITVAGDELIIDEDTAFVDVDAKVLYTGFEAVPDYDPADFVAIDTTGDEIYELIFIVKGDPENADDTYFFVTDTDDFNTYNKNKNYREQVVYVDGEKGEMVFTKAAHADIATEGLYKVVKTNASGIVTAIEAVAIDNTVKTVGTRSFSLDPEAEGFKPVQYVIDADTVIITVVIDDKGDYTVGEGTLKDMKDEDYDIVVEVLEASNSKKTADLIYIVMTEIGE